MNHLSLSTSETEPPFDDQPVSTEEVTLDLETSACEETLDLETGACEESPDVPQMAEETLVGSKLQQGKYQVLALRSGALADALPAGASYTALHTDLQKRLTLRYLPLDQSASADEREQATEQFLREVRALAKLDHPSLPRVHDYFCEGEACYVVMDELSERTLADVLAEAAEEGRAPALPPVKIAQLGLELVRALGYLHQQRPPLALGGLRAEDIALPADGPAQLVSLGALSMVASLSSVSLPGFASMPTLPESGLAAPEATAAPDAAAGNAPAAAGADADLYSLGLLLRELVGGAEVVARVMERLQRPDEVLQADGADDAPPISLVLAGVIQIAAHDEPGRRFQSAAAFETALMRAWTVERRIARQAGRGRRDEHATRLENGEDDLEATALELEPPEARPDEGLATRNFSLVGALDAEAEASVCWRCGGSNAPGSLLCRVCGARQPLAGEQVARARPTGPRRARTTRRLPPRAPDEAAWAEWGEDELEVPPVPARPRRTRPVSAGARVSAPPRRITAPPATGAGLGWASALSPAARAPVPPQAPVSAGGRRLLWGLMWVCFVMAFALGGATIVVTYLALR